MEPVLLATLVTSLGALAVAISALLGRRHWRLLGYRGEVGGELSRKVNGLSLRTAEQGKLLAEQRVRLDILELRSSLTPSKLGYAVSDSEVRLDRRDVASHSATTKDVTSRAVGAEGLTDLEQQILKLLATSSLTSTEVRARVNRSREHVARSLRRLYDLRLVTRDEASRPYTYTVR